MALRRWSPQNPDGDLVPLLQASIDAAKKRHPSGKAVPVNATVDVVLNAGDRCDADCPAAAAFRLLKSVAGTPGVAVLDMCGHHWRKHSPAMFAAGWVVVAGQTSAARP